MGACTIANKQQGVHNNKKVVEADVTFSSSYATSGDTVAITDLGMIAVDALIVPSHDLITGQAIADASSQCGLSLQLGGTVVAPKLKCYVSAGTEQTSTTDQSLVVVRVRFLGR